MRPLLFPIGYIVSCVIFQIAEPRRDRIANRLRSP